MHWMRLAFSFALDSAGSIMLARIAMIAMTTNNSISVKARTALFWLMRIRTTVSLAVFGTIPCFGGDCKFSALVAGAIALLGIYRVAGRRPRPHQCMEFEGLGFQKFLSSDIFCGRGCLRSAHCF